MPIGVLGLSPHQLRWLWPLSLFITFTFLLTIARALPPAAALAVGMAGVLVLGVAAVPRSPAAGGPALDANAIPVVRELDPQLAALEGGGPYLFETENLRFAEPYSVPIQAELLRRGVDVRVSEEGVVRQLGEARRADGTERERLVVLEGGRAREPMPGARRVAFASSMTAADQRELARLTDEVSAIIETDGLPLSALGEDAAEVGALPVDPDPYGVYRNAGQLTFVADLVDLVQLGLVAPEPDDRATFERWAELRYRAERETVGLFVVPLTEADQEQP